MKSQQTPAPHLQIKENLKTLVVGVYRALHNNIQSPVPIDPRVNVVVEKMMLYFYEQCVYGCYKEMPSEMDLFRDSWILMSRKLKEIIKEVGLAERKDFLDQIFEDFLKVQPSLEFDLMQSFEHSRKLLKEEASRLQYIEDALKWRSPLVQPIYLTIIWKIERGDFDTTSYADFTTALQVATKDKCEEKQVVARYFMRSYRRRLQLMMDNTNQAEESWTQFTVMQYLMVQRWIHLNLLASREISQESSVLNEPVMPFIPSAEFDPGCQYLATLYHNFFDRASLNPHSQFDNILVQNMSHTEWQKNYLSDLWFDNQSGMHKVNAQGLLLSNPALKLLQESRKVDAAEFFDGVEGEDLYLQSFASLSTDMERIFNHAVKNYENHNASFDGAQNYQQTVESLRTELMFHIKDRQRDKDWQEVMNQIPRENDEPILSPQLQVRQKRQRKETGPLLTSMRLAIVNGFLNVMSIIMTVGTFVMGLLGHANHFLPRITGSVVPRANISTVNSQNSYDYGVRNSLDATDAPKQNHQSIKP